MPPLESFLQRVHQSRALIKLGLNRLTGHKLPFSMSLSLTNRCNFRCAYCDLPLQHRPELSTTEWRQVIDEFRKGGMGRTSLIGGEPMLRSDLGEIIRYLKRSGLHAAMNSNGWYTLDRLEELRELDLVCLTLDGPREIHDTQRHAGSYDRVVGAAEALRGQGVTVVSMTVVTRDDPERLHHVLQVARSVGFVAYFQIEHDASADVRAPVAPQMSDEEVRNVARTLLRLKNAGWPVGNSRLLLEAQLRDGRRIGGRCSRCFAGRYFGYVLPDGTVAPCLLTQGTVDQRNGAECGYLRAFLELAQPVGPGCGCTPIHEINAVLSINPEAALEAARLALGNRVGRH